MFYEPSKGDHGLGRDPFKALLVPRPIGWVTTMNGAGRVNLAPFSFFNAVAEQPAMIMYTCGGRKPDRASKDSLANAREHGEFVWNLATWDLREKMNATASTLPAEIDEMAHAGLTVAPSRLVKPPRVAESPVQFECKVWQVLDLPGSDQHGPNGMVIGFVVGVHLRDDLIVDGRVKIQNARPIARLGYSEYTVIENAFRMPFPD
jgi:flavin reductase (DIM6/NTAB) family NADH-FMN oxidoreductase RutF